MELTSAELTVLGLIIERPQHGYDLEQVIERRGIRQWTNIGFSSIYYLLAKLEKRGLLDVAEGPRAAKSRRVFQATDLGREVAGRCALALIEEPRPVPHPVLVGLANLPLLSQEQYCRALRTRLTKLDATIAAVEAAREGQAPLPLPAQEVFSYSLSLMEAERQWLTTRVEGADHDDQDRLQEDAGRLPGAT